MTDEKNSKKAALEEAVKIVSAAIHEKETAYIKISQTDEQSPVMLEGRTRTGHYCQMMVDPKDVAKIFLEYGYHVWNVLGEEAPMAMWDDLAEHFGLYAVESVDL